MRKLVGAAAVALCLASPAIAQDSNGESNFDGLSFAAIAGVDAFSVQLDDAADSTRGLLYGVSAGYDLLAGNVVVGVQGEYSNSTASYDIDGLLVPGDEFSSDLGRNLYAGVRVGMHAGNKALVYVGAGYVNSKMTSNYSDDIETLSLSESKGGFRVSGGGEFALDEAFFARLEMRYQDLGDYNVFDVDTGFARTNTQIIAGLGARF